MTLYEDSYFCDLTLCRAASGSWLFEGSRFLHLHQLTILKRNLVCYIYKRNQSVPRCKHFPPRL